MSSPLMGRLALLNAAAGGICEAGIEQGNVGVTEWPISASLVLFIGPNFYERAGTWAYSRWISHLIGPQTRRPATPSSGTSVQAFWKGESWWRLLIKIAGVGKTGERGLIAERPMTPHPATWSDGAGTSGAATRIDGNSRTGGITSARL